MLLRQAVHGPPRAAARPLQPRQPHSGDAILRRIAHKHASLGIAPEQYEVVHEHLFAAIAAVLGEAVTPAVAAAWDEVYWLMAHALIAIERQLYEKGGTGGGWREWEVVGRAEETADVVAFELRPGDGGPAPVHRAGQYVSVQVTLPDGARQIRQYSLAGAPGSATLRIGVKRVHGGGTPDGEVSNHLHAHVHVGDRLRVSAPYGDLVLDQDTDAPLLLASAGIGVTPMVAMLEQLVLRGHDAPVTVVHADRSPAGHALRADHEGFAAKLPDASVHVWYEQPEPGHPADRTGLVDLSALDVPSGTRAYLCGPLPFMRAVRAQLIGKGVAPADIHYEVFGPDLWLARD